MSSEKLSLTLLFEDPGFEHEPISVSDASEALGELDKVFEKIQRFSDWKSQNEAICLTIALLKGGILQHRNVHKRAVDIFGVLSACSVSARTTLMKNSCLLIVYFVQNGIGDGEKCLEVLSPRLNHGTKLVAVCSRLTILSVVKNCKTKRVLGAVINLSESPSAETHVVCMECFALVFKWKDCLINKFWSSIENVFKKLSTDPSPDVRFQTKNALSVLQEEDPVKFKELISLLDSRTQKSFTLSTHETVVQPVAPVPPAAPPKPEKNSLRNHPPKVLPVPPCTLR